MNTESSPTPLPRHLTEAEFAEIISGSTGTAGFALTAAEEHALLCEQCTAELAALRESLDLFREASAAYANAELRRIPAVKLPRRRVLPFPLRPVYLAAAAALVLASVIPMQLLHQRSQKIVRQAASASTATSVERYATESNEALLDDVDRAASASVPESMQALADPMGANDLSVQTSKQRKD